MWLILYESATAGNAIAVLEEGIKCYALEEAVPTKEGSQFCANAWEKEVKGESEFERYLWVNGIKGIAGRVKSKESSPQRG